MEPAKKLVICEAYVAGHHCNFKTCDKFHGEVCPFGIQCMHKPAICSCMGHELTDEEKAEHYMAIDMEQAKNCPLITKGLCEKIHPNGWCSRAENHQSCNNFDPTHRIMYAHRCCMTTTQVIAGAAGALYQVCGYPTLMGQMTCYRHYQPRVGNGWCEKSVSCNRKDDDTCSYKKGGDIIKLKHATDWCDKEDEEGHDRSKCKLAHTCLGAAIPQESDKKKTALSSIFEAHSKGKYKMLSMRCGDVAYDSREKGGGNPAMPGLDLCFWCHSRIRNEIVKKTGRHGRADAWQLEAAKKTPAKKTTAKKTTAKKADTKESTDADGFIEVKGKKKKE